MKSWKNLNLLILSCLISCSTNHKVAQEPHQFTKGTRAIASGTDFSARVVRKTLKRIFHSYLLGQVLLNDFDNILDKNPASAMDSESYSELQTIREIVDQSEESISEMYLMLVMVNALPEYSENQKANASEGLKNIEQFLDGTTSEHKAMPENLKHLILANLREKQIVVRDELKMISEDSSITQNNPEVVASFHKKMALLRGKKWKLFKGHNEYDVNEDDLNQVLNEQALDQDFKTFKSDVKRISKEMRKLNRIAKRNRTTSSDTIYPNAGSAGNITGSGFPANTWSITYDDGPGGKTTPTVLQNLKAHNMKATFFMLGKQVEGLPTTAKSVVDAGMDIASHSYDHAQLTKVGPIALEKQIGGAKKIIEAKLGKTIKLFRLPYGAGVSSSSIRAKIAEHGMVHIFWNVDTLDWQDKNPTSIFNRAVKQMKATSKNSGVVLFHDIHAQSVIASELLMDYFEEQKSNVCSVQAVIDQLNKGLATCQQ